jgi:nucleoside-diphosphate-sugar epimerase
MHRTIFITGASGALGPHLLAELLRDEENHGVVAVLRPSRRSLSNRADELRTAIERLTSEQERGRIRPMSRLELIEGDVRRCDLGLESRDLDRVLRSVDVIVHAAAKTRFTAAPSELHDANVEGTRQMLALAHRHCPRLRQFLFVSTTCVAGTKTGSIPECLQAEPAAFMNGYERTKWEAEWQVATSDLPTRIARLSTCIGGERAGYVHRFGAIHQSMRWLIRGLVPMVPAADGARVDLIATDVAAQWLARAVATAPDGLEVCHVAAGQQAIPLRQLLESAVAHLRNRVPAWKRGQIEPPAIVDAATFEVFARSIADSGDALFARVLEAAESFFPALLYPKVYQTDRAERLWGGPLPLSDWRSTLARVIDFGCASEWRRPAREVVHAA